jgi:hypothetical protein
VYRHPERGLSIQLPAMQNLQLDSTVRVSGICVLDKGDQFQGPAAFRILLRSSQDLKQLTGPSLVSVRNLGIVAGILLLVLLAAVARALLLERRLHGVGLAGDAFDARIVRKLVSPALGSNSEARSLNKILPAVPAWIYSHLERWHYLSFLRTNNVREILKSARVRALQPEKIEALIAVIEGDLGYQLHQAVQKVKFELSQSESAEFAFRDGASGASMVELRIPITRTQFESWISEDLAAIEHCVDALLKSACLDPHQVDRVFLTGGSSFVPAVRQTFIRRFGQSRIRGGNEFTSVAQGLALRAAEGYVQD